jgi:hypothetical protein
MTTGHHNPYVIVLSFSLWRHMMPWHQQHLHCMYLCNVLTSAITPLLTLACALAGPDEQRGRHRDQQPGRSHETISSNSR